MHVNLNLCIRKYIFALIRMKLPWSSAGFGFWNKYYLLYLCCSWTHHFARSFFDTRCSISRCLFWYGIFARSSRATSQLELDYKPSRAGRLVTSRARASRATLSSPTWAVYTVPQAGKAAIDIRRPPPSMLAWARPLSHCGAASRTNPPSTQACSSLAHPGA